MYMPQIIIVTFVTIKKKKDLICVQLSYKAQKVNKLHLKICLRYLCKGRAINTFQKSSQT